MNDLILELLNCGIYEEASITFSHGLNLLQGNSGSGKSTILNAIQLAITGESKGNMKRIQEDNKRSKEGYVQMSIPGLEITRPIIRSKTNINKTIINGKEGMQNIQDILQLFPENSIYALNENSNYHFLNLDKAKKTQTIESFAFDKVDVIEIVSKLKENKKTMEKQKIMLETQRSAYEETLKNMVIQEIQIDDKYKQRTIEEQYTIIQNLETELKKIIEYKSEWNTYLQRKEDIEQQCVILKKDKNKHLKNLNEMNKDDMETRLEQDETLYKYKTIEENLARLYSQQKEHDEKELNDLMERRDTLFTEMENYPYKLQTIEKQIQLWRDRKNLKQRVEEKRNKVMKETESILSEKEYNELKQKIEEYEIQLAQTKRYVCDCCNPPVEHFIHDDKLQRVDLHKPSSKEKQREIQECINQLNEKIQESEECEKG